MAKRTTKTKAKAQKQAWRYVGGADEDDPPAAIMLGDKTVALGEVVSDPAAAGDARFVVCAAVEN